MLRRGLKTVSETYTFECGCSFPVLGPPPSPGALPLMQVDDENLPWCHKTWELMARGWTKGVFQLESPLGRQFTKKLRPENGEHIGALGAILRPGCLKSYDADGFSMTDRYCKVKNHETVTRMTPEHVAETYIFEIKPYHPAIDPILAQTMGCLIYQEQAMQIAQAVAGFDLMAADQLRKAIGKKLAAEMAKCKTMFMDGCAKANIISTAQAEELFGWIEKSQRYNFNKSHAISYGLTGYDTGYIKAHFPVAFYTSWLNYAKGGQDPKAEVYELVTDAKLLDIDVLTPDLRTLEPNVSTDGVKIRFGLTDIAGVGAAHIEHVKESVTTITAALNKKLADLSWLEFLIHVAPKIQSNVMEGLIGAGALSWFKVSRTRMWTEYQAVRELTDKEALWLKNHTSEFSDLVVALKRLSMPKYKKPKRKSDPVPIGPFGGCANVKREAAIKSEALMLESPATTTQDSPRSIARLEEKFLGIALTFSEVDAYDLSDVNTSCKQFNCGAVLEPMIFGVKVKEIRKCVTKRGKNPGQEMARVTIEDGSGYINDAVAFPEAWKTFGPLLTEGNMVVIRGKKDYKQGSLFVEKVCQLYM